MTCEANRVADALEACDWTKPSIGNKAILRKAVELLRNQHSDLKTARNDALEEAAQACEGKAQGFLSPEYATGQPLSSFSERFACGECAAAIRALADKPAPTGADHAQVADTGQAVAWLRDLDGTGSLHPAAEGDPGAFPVYEHHAPLDAERLREAGTDFIIAVDNLLDWMNGNELSADHKRQMPNDFQILCSTLTDFRAALRQKEAGE